MPVTLLGFRATIDKKNWEINKRKKKHKDKSRSSFLVFFFVYR